MHTAAAAAATTTTTTTTTHRLLLRGWAGELGVRGSEPSREHGVVKMSLPPVSVSGYLCEKTAICVCSAVIECMRTLEQLQVGAAPQRAPERLLFLLRLLLPALALEGVRRELRPGELRLGLSPVKAIHV